MESIILLAVAVTVFKAFFAEGYLISTGSMAPSLLGYHKRVTCPNCQYTFARGTAFDQSTAKHKHVSGELTGDIARHDLAECPICSSSIVVDSLPATEGDQLLVHKHHYTFRDPRRWEVIVFQSPQKPTQAYVKRVVGLPGETIEILDGNVYADGVLQRKPLVTQLSLRLPVDNQDHRPRRDGENVVRRWYPTASVSNWLERDGAFAFRGKSVRGSDTPDEAPAAREAIPAATDIDWMEYHHDRSAQRTGTTSSPAIIDLCSYNAPDRQQVFPVHELMLELQLTPLQSQGDFVMSLHDGMHWLRCTFDFAGQEVRLTADDKPTVHRSAPLPQSLKEGEATTVVLSLFDRQVLLAIDGELLFEPLFYAQDGTRQAISESPVRIGARQGDFLVTHLQLFRDVYYTPPADADEVETAGGVIAATNRLDDDEFFVLGDNSPVSLDSRSWEHPAVPRSLLIGRPFVVHLPSQQRLIPWKGHDQFVRFPDPSRIRYIH